jgi:signal transduction histidine kinase
MSMRWWLSVAFAVVAGITVVAATVVLSSRSERAVRERAAELALGHTAAAAKAIVNAPEDADLDELVHVIADRRELSLFAFDTDGSLLTAQTSRRTKLEWIPEADVALREALRGERYVETFGAGKAAVVGIPMRRQDAVALVGYAPRPELVTGLGVVRDKLFEAALWAVVLGAGVGLVVASLITARLRGIGDAAAAIASGDFETPLRPRFRDELGALAAAVDVMREGLRESFSRLQSERDRFEMLLERLHDGVITVDNDLNVEFANAEARRLFGATLEPGHTLPEPWPRVSLHMLVTDMFRPAATVVQARISPNEEQTYALVGLPTIGGDVAILVVTDVTLRERRERAEREFVANAAHELSTPLATISSAYEVLQSGAKELPADRDRFLDMIGRQVARLGRLSRALLVLARAQTHEEAPQLESVPVRPILDELQMSLQAAEGVELAVDCAEELVVLAQRDLLEQILENLGRNAVKHTAHGAIVLRARQLPDLSAAIEVSDTGPGISAQEQERIFDRFYRAGARDAKGFGLGLAIAREATQALGGRIEVESSPGSGTTVRVILSRATKAAV